MSHIEISGIRKTFEVEDTGPAKGSVGVVQGAYAQWGNAMSGKALALDGVDLDIPDGKVMVVLGPSGCGKSTLLRIIAGLEEADEGIVKFDGEVVEVRSLPPDKRGIGMVFQDYALYPGMKAKSNILSAFIFRKKDPEHDAVAMEKFRKTGELLGVEMSYLMERNPRQLSGGEQQRVAIGRCITRDPKLFLLDEPFSSLDAKLRETYRVQLKRLLGLYRVTSIYVTHDQREAQVLADRVAVMRRGKIEQVGEYMEIYEAPVNAFVADFVSLDSELPPIIMFDGGLLGAEYSGRNIGVRPEDFEISSTETAGSMAVSLVQYRPSPLRGDAVYTLKLGEKSFQVRGSLRDGLHPGAALWLRPRKVHVFDASSGVRMETRT